MTTYLWVKPHTGNCYTVAYVGDSWGYYIGAIARAEFVINLSNGEIVKDRFGGDVDNTQPNPIQYLVDNKYITKTEALDLRLKLNV